MEELKIALIGAGFMGKAHSMAFATMPMCYWPAPALPVRDLVIDIDKDIAEEAMLRFGFSRFGTDWKQAVTDPSIDIIDIATPNDMHLEIAIEAFKNGKHVFCEKPIARNVAEAEQMYNAAKSSGVKHMLAFNYRRTPGVLLAKEIIEKGEIGSIQSFRGTYHQDWSAAQSTPISWRFQKDISGSGALGDLGSHVIDLARFLVSEISHVTGYSNTLIGERPIRCGGVDTIGNVQIQDRTRMATVDVDDEVSFICKFKNGASGSIEATRNAWGRNNFITLEIYGDKGSIYFNYENRDELQVFYADDPVNRRGFRTIYTGPAHPEGSALWPIPALGIGYIDTKIIECHDFIQAIIENKEVSPNFKDGFEIAKICDAVQRLEDEGSWLSI
ncbi:MAG: Gfo/Idh/MocA family oxidoreductase [Spirochaetaceae bacterium]|nr:Gfo/Idh/MocA family oxidoreductase [Spirochaetaceae bacterium]